MAFSTSVNAQIKVLPSGDFAIGQNYITNNDYKVEINGERKTALALSTRHENAYSWASISKAINSTSKHWIVSLNGYNSHNFWVYTWGGANAVSYTTWSDSSFKKNFRPIENAWSLVSQLNPTVYDYKEGFNGSESYDSAIYTNQPGFIAQELQEVIPSLVNPMDESGKLGVNYQGLIPILTQCIKEQNERIELLEAQVQGCCNGSPNNNEIDNSLMTGDEQAIENQIYLENSKIRTSWAVKPNPNNGHFTLTFANSVVPISIESILITDLSGKRIDGVAISNVVAGSVNVDMSQNSSGVYYIHLIDAENVLDTKKVIIKN